MPILLSVSSLASISAFSQDAGNRRDSPPPEIRHLSDSRNRAEAVREFKNRSETRRKAAIEKAKAKGFPIRGQRDGRFFELSDLDEDGRPVYLTTLNKQAAISSGASQIRNTGIYQLNGSGWTVGVWDGGSIRTTHQEFGARVTSLDGASVSSHATHVAGTIGASGVTTNAQGMAPSVTIDSYDWNSDLSEMAARAAASANIAGSLVLSNHSYGYITGWDSNRYYGRYPDREDERFGSYDSNAASIDALCVNAPYYLPFIAAGNDRTDTAPTSGATFEYYSGGNWVSKAYDPNTDPYDDGWDNGGFDTIEGYGVAKNVVTIGAVNDAVAGSTRVPANGTMTTFSSWGPTDDGRIKPDLVANGYSLYSSDSGSNSQYSYKSGTSMATPSAM
ncbi:MAG: S8 family serine peptidase, partial [Verrucomicrobiae bacterium]|nr:S8 family serine peptidase [Verrucomicrobiae bacterium]